MKKSEFRWIIRVICWKVTTVGKPLRRVLVIRKWGISEKLDRTSQHVRYDTKGKGEHVPQDTLTRERAYAANRSKKSANGARIKI